MQAEREAFLESGDARLGELHYCLVPLTQTPSGRASGLDRLKTQAEAMRIGLSAGIYTVAGVVRWADTIIETRNAPDPAIIAVSLKGNDPASEVANCLFDVPGNGEYMEALRYVLRDLRRRLDHDPSSAEHIAQCLYQLASTTLWPEDEFGPEAYYLDDTFELLRTGTYRGAHHDAVRDLRDYLLKTGGT